MVTAPPPIGQLSAYSGVNTIALACKNPLSILSSRCEPATGRIVGRGSRRLWHSSSQFARSGVVVSKSEDRMTDPKRQRGERGLDDTLDRLRIALQSTGRDPLIAFTESMAWLYYVREWHRNNLPDLHPRSDASDEGKTFQAIIWARGLDTHGTRDVADLIVDLSSSGILGAGVLGTFVLGSPGQVRWTWVDRADLPPSTRDPHGCDLHYETFVAGRSILDPLIVAQAFIKGLP
jgi:hypothetical protein